MATSPLISKSAFISTSSTPEGTQPNRPERRRPTRVQGLGLEKLGHAIEYLVDSRAIDSGALRLITEKEAISMLSLASRALYSECEVVASRRGPIARWWWSGR